MKRCTKCGKDNDDLAPKCAGCDMPFEAVKVSPPPIPIDKKSTRAKTSGMAVGSLVLGISGILPLIVTSLAGLILGIVSLVTINNSDGKLRGRGMAIAGITLCALSLLLLPLMLLPALNAAKRKAEMIVCMNHEHQLVVALHLYADENQSQFPPSATWCDAIQPLMGTNNFFNCPACQPPHRCDYAFNSKLSGLNRGSVNPRCVLLFESDEGWNGSGGSEAMITTSRHVHVFIVGFEDGTVQFVTPAQLGTLRWDP